MKIVLFINTEGNIYDHLEKKLKDKGLFVVKSKENADEVDQVGQQQGSSFMIFGGPKIPYQFLKENEWAFRTKRVLFLGKQPNLTANISQKLSEVSLEVFDLANVDKLVQKIDSFFDSNKQSDELYLDDIEFSINQDMKKVQGEN